VLTLLSGRVVVVFDTLASTNEGPVTLALGAMDQEWHPSTASWTLAVDTALDERPWDEEGAGPVVPYATTVWDPALGDTAFFELDSAQVAFWGDTAQSAAARGARLDVVTPGVRLKMDFVALRVDLQPSVNPDTVVAATVPRTDLTFVYTPFPEPPPDGIRIGGVPAWRSVLDLDVPAELNGPAELCAAVGCPLLLTPDRINYAALVLQGRRSELAFQPSDSVGLDVRPVLLRSALPKAPLGSSLVGLTGRRVAPEVFGDAEGTEVEIPFTNYVRALVTDDSTQADPPSKTLALLSVFEPVSIAFASFYGPGTPGAPVLKLILTAGKSVELP
jgi:hypothetical protein